MYIASKNGGFTFSSRDRPVSRRNVNLVRDKWKRHCYSGYAYYAWESLVKKRHVIEETRKKERKKKKRYVERLLRRKSEYALSRTKWSLILRLTRHGINFRSRIRFGAPIELEVASRLSFNRATSVFASLRRTITSPTSRTQSPKVLSDRVKPV